MEVELKRTDWRRWGEVKEDSRGSRYHVVEQKSEQRERQWKAMFKKKKRSVARVKGSSQRRFFRQQKWGTLFFSLQNYKYSDLSLLWEETTPPMQPGCVITLHTFLVIACACTSIWVVMWRTGLGKSISFLRLTCWGRGNVNPERFPGQICGIGTCASKAVEE